MSFYRMIKPLSEDYKVYAIDLLGMGLSSRPDFKLKDPKDVIQFFVDSIEEWRKVLGI